MNPAFNPIVYSLFSFAETSFEYDMSKKKRAVCLVGSYENGKPSKIENVTPINYKEKMGSGVACTWASKHFETEAGSKTPHDNVYVMSPAKSEPALVDPLANWTTKTGDGTATMTGTSLGDYFYKFVFTVSGDLGSAMCIVYKKNAGDSDTNYANLGSFTIAGDGVLAMPDAAGLVATFVAGASGGSGPVDFVEGDTVEFETKGASSQTADFIALLGSKIFQKAVENFRYVVFCNKSGFNFAFAEEVDLFADMMSVQLGRRAIYGVPYEVRDDADDFKTAYIPAYKTGLEQFKGKCKSKAVVTSPFWSTDGYNLVGEGIAKKALLPIVESPAKSKYSELKHVTKWESDSSPDAMLQDADLWMDIENEFAYEAGGLPFSMIGSEQYGRLRLHSVYLPVDVPSLTSVDQRRTIQDCATAFEVLDWAAYLYWGNYYNEETESDYETLNLMLSQLSKDILEQNTFKGQLKNIRIVPIDAQLTDPNDPDLDPTEAAVARDNISSEHATSGTVRCKIFISAYSHNEQSLGIAEFKKNEN